MVKKKHINLIHILGAGSAISLSSLAYFIISPPVTNGANAEEATTTLTIVSEPTMSVALDPTVNMSFIPKENGEFQSGTAKLKIVTSNVDGYKVLMSMADNNADITTTDSDGVISSITTNNVTQDNSNSNSWGYNLVKSNEEITTYNAIPATSSQIKYVSADKIDIDGGDEYNLAFGVNINAGLPAGTYSKQITISVVANPVELDSLQHLTYMQDITTSACAKTRGENGETNITIGNEPSKQLIDLRDGKYYWVSKLADQNCWMTQNLDYDIPETINATIVSQSDNIPAEWKPTERTRTGALNLSGYSESNYTSGYSWDPGNYKQIGSDGDVSCDTIGTGQNLNNCNRVSSTMALNDASAKNDLDLHYHIGNYYQWPAATAGTGNSATTVGADASSSVCPKGWQLPQATQSTSSNVKVTYQKLIDAYSIGQKVDILMNTPLYFPRSGNISSDGYSKIGSGGNFWSSTSYVPTHAFNLFYSGASSIGTWDAPARYNGYTVRCVAK